MKTEVEKICSTCEFWIPEYGSCYKGKSLYCSQYTSPQHSCTWWKDKRDKEKMLICRRTKEGRYLGNG